MTLQISADVRTYAWILAGPDEDKKATLVLDALESPPDEYRPGITISHTIGSEERDHYMLNEYIAQFGTVMLSIGPIG